MIRKPEEQLKEVFENMRGGNGAVEMRSLLNDPQEMNGKGKFLKHITLPVGASIGQHPHNNETETYYILSGTGEYNDNGTVVSCGAGDVLHTYSGQSHGISNSGCIALELIALILYI